MVKQGLEQGGFGCLRLDFCWANLSNYSFGHRLVIGTQS